MSNVDYYYYDCIETYGDVSTYIILIYVTSLAMMLIYSHAIEWTTHLQLIKYLKKKKSENVDDIFCVICMEKNASTHNFIKLNCGHKFHMDCLQKWMLINPVCPICREEDPFCPSVKKIHFQ